MQRTADFARQGNIARRSQATAVPRYAFRRFGQQFKHIANDYQGEDLSTCAKNAGFVLPDDSVHDSSSNMTSMGMGATSATTTAESTVVGTMTVIPLVRQSSAPTATDIQNVTCGFATSASSMMTPAPVPVAAPASPAAAVPTASTMPAMPTLIQHTNATAPPPLVEVSFAARRASPLAGLRMMVGVVGVLGLFF